MKNVRLRRIIAVLLVCAMAGTRLIGEEAELIHAREWGK